MRIDGRSLGDILNTFDAAKHIGMSKSTLEKWRLRNVGPRWIVLGTYKVGYRVSDLEDWLHDQTRGGPVHAEAELAA